MTRITLALAVIVALAAAACNNGPGGNADMKTLQDSAAYAMGADLAKSLKQAEVELNPDLIYAGFRDTKEGKSLLTDEGVQKAIMSFSRQIREKQMAAMTKKADSADVAGKAFLAAKEKEAGVQKTASGLLYKVEKPGSGKTPTAKSTVKVNYEGKLSNGKVFDSSYERNEPTEFEVGQVIPGWQEGLQLMKAGATYYFYIPAELGYGRRGAGSDIGPNEVLEFKVELLEVK